jgi:serine/threonine-protein kinase
LRQVLELPPGAAAPTRLMPSTSLDRPQTVAVDDDGNVYVVDGGSRRVLKLGAGATTPEELPFAGLSAPYGVAVTKDGTVYVADPVKRVVMKLPRGATTAAEVHFPGLRFPLGVAADGAGDLYVSECNNDDACANGSVSEIGGGA